MGFFSELIMTILKMFFLMAVAVGGVMTGKALRNKKNAK